MCVTSPPYWGFRSYGTEPQIWGGDSECAHQWGASIPRYNPTKHTNPATDGKHAYKPAEALPGGHGSFCAKCAAWYGELGQEPTVGLYIEHMVEVFRQVWRVLRKDGTLWLNLGDNYAGSGLGGCKTSTLQSRARAWADPNDRPPGYSRQRSPEGLKPKDLIGVPWRVAFALQQDGWWLRRDIIWDKTTCMPESVADRPSSTHEYLFLLAKSRHYFYDRHAIREKHDGKRSKTSNQGGGNKRSVWRVGVSNSDLPHYAMYPPKLIEPCILSGTSAYGCCGQCGAPWRRVVERTEGTYAERKARGVGGPYNRNPELRRQAVGTLTNSSYTTIGWKPSCKCEVGQLVPAVVLDPFNGAGTTGVVAIGHNRSYIGIDLSQKNIETSMTYISTMFPLLVWRDLAEIASPSLPATLTSHVQAKVEA